MSEMFDQVWGKLHQRLGRGGVRLSYEEAAYLVDILEPVEHAMSVVNGRPLSGMERNYLRIMIDQRKRTATGRGHRVAV